MAHSLITTLDASHSAAVMSMQSQQCHVTGTKQTAQVYTAWRPQLHRGAGELSTVQGGFAEGLETRKVPRNDPCPVGVFS